MTLALDLADQRFAQNFYVRVTPRRLIDFDDLEAGNDGVVIVNSFVKKFYFDPKYGRPVSVKQNGTGDNERLTKAAMNTGQGWYWEESTNYIYVLAGTFSEILEGDIVTVEYHKYFSTVETYWYSDPKDDTTDLVTWLPLITQVPAVRATATNQLFGFAPVSSTTLGVANEDQFFNEEIANSSFLRAPIKMWTKLGDTDDTADYYVLLDTICGNVTSDYGSVSIEINDSSDVFNSSFRSIIEGTFGLESSFYNTTDYPNVDPSFIGSAKRIVFGYRKGVVLVNLDYEPDANTESDNQLWAAHCYSQNAADALANRELFKSFKSQIDFGATTTGSATSRIYFTSATSTGNYEVGDWIIVTNSDPTYSDPPDYSSHRRQVSAIGANFIDLASSFTFTNSTTARAYRSEIPRVRVEQNGVVYTLRCFVHYWGKTDDGIMTLEFLSGYSSALANPISHTDSVFADIYGQNFISTPTIAADPVWDIDANVVGTIYEILNQYVGIDTSELDTTTFETLAGENIGDRIGVVIPETVTGIYPKFLEVLNKLATTARVRLLKDSSNRWTVSRIEPFEAADFVISDHDIVSITSQYDTADILSDVFVEYDTWERGPNAGDTQEYPLTTSFHSGVARYFNNIKKQETFKSYHVDENDAQTLAETISDYYSTRRGLHKVLVTRTLYDVTLNSSIEIKRSKIGGKVFDDSIQTITGKVVEFSKTPTTISLTIDDQKGLGDNS